MSIQYITYIYCALNGITKRKAGVNQYRCCSSVIMHWYKLSCDSFSHIQFNELQVRTWLKIIGASKNSMSESHIHA